LNCQENSEIQSIIVLEMESFLGLCRNKRESIDAVDSSGKDEEALYKGRCNRAQPDQALSLAEGWFSRRSFGDNEHGGLFERAAISEMKKSRRSSGQGLVRHSKKLLVRKTGECMRDKGIFKVRSDIRNPLKTLSHWCDM
jgi:hypothetical protein